MKKKQINFGVNEIEFIESLLAKKPLNILSPKEEFVANHVKQDILERFHEVLDKGSYYSGQ